MVIKYLWWYPEIFKIPSDLTIYKSFFLNDGPYKVFTKIETEYHNITRVYMSKQYWLFKTGFQANPKVIKMIIMKIKHEMLMSRNVSSCKVRRILAETVGTDIKYRCKNCRNCKACKECNNTEMMNIIQEVDQHIINKYVKINTNKHVAFPTLISVHDTVIKLTPNKDRVLHGYNQWRKKLNANPQDKNFVM